MCGIGGILEPRGRIDDDGPKRLAGELIRRGPDDSVAAVTDDLRRHGATHA